MSQEVIDIGVNADDGTGDSLFQAGQKINDNFTELYELASVSADIKFFGNEIQARYYWNYVLSLEETEDKLKKSIEVKLIKGI